MKNLEFTLEGFDGFALQSQAAFVPPSAVQRMATFSAEVAAQPPPPPPAPKKMFRLSPAELAKIDRNCARLSSFGDATSAMF